MTGERDPRVTAVAEVINRRTGYHMGVESWLPCAQEVIDRLDGIDPLDRLRARLTPPAGGSDE